jgi:3',5'-cyclic AMP phosphodiesterase CpdA
VRIAQLSDLHVHEGGASIGELVDANATLAAAIEFLRGLVPPPDAVVATGDLTDNGRPEQYAVLRELLDACEPPLYLLPGNHDERAPLLEAFPDHTYLPTGGGPLSYAIEDHPVRIVGLDTTIPGRHDAAFDADARRWLDDTLSARPDAPTLVCTHHPPFDTGVWWMDCVGLPDDDRRAFEDTIRRHAQVQRVLCGHIHRPVQTMWGSTLVSVAPSTAHQIALDVVPLGSMRLTSEPPMLTLLDWTDERVLTHTTTFLPADVIDIGASMPDGAKEALLTRPPAPKGGAFS